jgi:hypothetical protein
MNDTAVYDFAKVWAIMDGKAWWNKEASTVLVWKSESHRIGYLEEAKDFIERLEKQGWVLKFKEP